MEMDMTLDYRLRWMDFDRYGRLKPASALDIFQDLATLQAERMGIGRADMLVEGVFWAVVRMKLELLQEPERFDVVTVRTWPHSLTRFSFLRDFTMHGPDGALLAQAEQEWVLMDAVTRKFASVKDYYHGPTDFCDDRVFERKARKAPDFAEGNREEFTVVPSYSDIDVNGHVNNAVYADYLINALEPGPEGALRTLQVDYRHEALPGEPLTVCTRVEEGRVLQKGVLADGTVAFSSVVELR